MAFGIGALVFGSGMFFYVKKQQTHAIPSGIEKERKETEIVDIDAVSMAAPSAGDV